MLGICKSAIRLFLQLMELSLIWEQTIVQRRLG